MKIALVLGTRPEIIKMSPIIRFLEKNKNEYFIIHTNQHYSKNLDEVFFKELELPKVKYNLNVGSGLHGEQTARMMVRIEEIFLKEKPNKILVQGDTNTVLSASIVASKLKIDLGHIEAGLRSGDKNMPEEINRIVADHCSTYLFTPTENSSKNLLNENIKQKNIYMVGNTIVDAIQQNLKIAQKKSDIIKKLNLQEKNYILVTTHRAENVDNKNRLKRIFK